MTKAELWLISQGRKEDQETIDLLDEYLKHKIEELTPFIMEWSDWSEDREAYCVTEKSVENAIKEFLK